MERRRIENETHDTERAYYASKNTDFYNITIEGPTDGESAFKECRDITIHNSKIALRYCLWHDENLEIYNTHVTEKCRAPFWYDRKIKLRNVILDGIKPFRECTFLDLKNVKVSSDEPFWKCNYIFIDNCEISGMYPFFMCNNIEIKNIKFDGKYSFQYCKNLKIEDSNIDTKDAFWHNENTTVKNTVLKGQYLGWYSKNLTLINCKIIGTQPLCYCKNLKLIDCTMEECDLAFEYSDVEATINGHVDSIKNPLNGHIVCDSCGEVIIDENDRSNGKASIKIKK